MLRIAGKKRILNSECLNCYSNNVLFYVHSIQPWLGNQFQFDHSEICIPCPVEVFLIEIGKGGVNVLE
jgi:hypothetical protein